MAIQYAHRMLSYFTHILIQLLIRNSGDSVAIDDAKTRQAGPWVSETALRRSATFTTYNCILDADDVIYDTTLWLDFHWD